MSITLFFILGLCFGSFGSVLITRVPGGRTICGRSGCPQCEKKLTPLELVPVLSYFALRGRCTGCSKPIGLLYPSTELASGFLFLLAYWVHGVTAPGLLLALCLWLLLVIMIIDTQTQTISDMLNIPFFFLSVTYAVALDRFLLGGMMLGAGFFGSLWLLSRGRWIGSGDIILAAGIGALMGGWEYMLACLLLTYIGGGVFVGFLLLMGKVHRGQHIAFGPFLALGALATLLLHAKIDIFLTVYFGM